VTGAAGAVLLGLLLWVYVGMLDRHGYWYDEVMTVLTARSPFVEMVNERLREGHPPLFFAETWLWTRIVGEREALVRLPTLLAALGSAALLHRIVRRLAGPGTARLALLLLLVAPFQLRMAHVARPYALVQVLALGLTALILRAEERPARRDPLLAGLLGFGLLATHYSALLLLAGALGYLLVARRGRLAAGLALGAALAAPFAVVTARLRSVTGAIDWLGEPRPGALAKVLAEQVADVQWLVGHPWLGAVLAVPLLAAAGVGALMLGRRGRVVVFGWLGPLAAGLVALALGAPNIFGVSRYWVAPLAHQTALLAVALAALAQRRPRLGLLAAALVAGTALFGSAALVERDHAPDWRGLVHALEARRRPGEPVVVDLEPQQKLLWRYYATTLCYDLAQIEAGPRERRWARPPTPDDDAQEHAPRLTAGTDSLLVFFGPPPEGRAADWLAELERRYPRRSELEMPAGTLLRLSRGPID